MTADEDEFYQPDDRQHPTFGDRYWGRPTSADTAERGQSRLDQLRAALVSSAQLDDLPKPEPLLDGYLMRDSLAWLHGKRASYKSFLALDWASCISTGLPWRMNGVQLSPVLYVVAEGTLGLLQRVRAWEEANKTTSRVTFLPVAVQFMDNVDFVAIQQIAIDMHAGLIIIDTQSRCTVGKDENSGVDMSLYVAALDKLRIATRACVLNVHHEPRAGENLRGHTTLEGSAESIFRMSRDGIKVTLTCSKQKDAEENEEMVLYRNKVGQSMVLGMLPDDLGSIQLRSDIDCQVLTELRDTFGSNDVSASVLLKVTNLSERSFYRSLKHLVELGDVVKGGTDNRPKYRAA